MFSGGPGTFPQAAVAHWLSCRPRQLRVAWNDVGRPLPIFLRDAILRAGGTLVVDEHNSTNLTNRFQPVAFLTQAVFSVDEDLIYACEELWEAYAVWMKYPQRMVGFCPRHWPHGIPDVDVSPYFPFGYSRASLVLPTKGAFLHRRYYTAYFSPELAGLRGVVDARCNGEDLLMCFLQAAAAGQEDARPEVIVSGSAKPAAEGCGLEGIATKPGFFAERLDLTTACSRHFAISFIDIGIGFRDFYTIDPHAGTATRIGQFCGFGDGEPSDIWLALCSLRLWIRGTLVNL